MRIRRPPLERIVLDPTFDASCDVLLAARDLESQLRSAALPSDVAAATLGTLEEALGTIRTAVALLVRDAEEWHRADDVEPLLAAIAQALADAASGCDRARDVLARTG